MSALSRAERRQLRRPRRPLSPGLAGIARRAALAALAQLEGGELVLELPGGEVRRLGDGNGLPVRATVHSDRLFRRLAIRGSVGLGEAYVAGEWESDDLPELIALLLRNADAASQGRPWSWLGRVREHRPHLARRERRRRARRHVSYHYDLGNELFALFLDDSLTYSCALFERPGMSLEEAQRAKLRLLADKLAVGREDHVLEIGCGWGSLALFVAAERGARVTGVTLSAEQAALARAPVDAAGLGDRIEIVCGDYRDLDGQFTKIASVEMIEAIGERELGRFFATCDRLLAPDGLVALQTIAVPDQRFARYRRSRDWIQRTIFPGSLIPSLTALAQAMTRASRFVLHDLEDIGPSYAPTLAEWRRRFTAHAAEVRALGYDERFVRAWHFYLASCEALFATRSLRDLQLVLTRPLNESLPRYRPGGEAR